MPHYPFPSEYKHQIEQLVAGEDYFEHRTADIQQLLKQQDGPVVEIGGPTETGFYFLDGLELPSSPIITNISANPLPFHPEPARIAEHVAMQMDGTAMPYEDNSVAVFLMSAMSLSSDWWVELSDDEKDRMEPQFDRELKISKLEMSQVAAGLLAPEAVTEAQRVKIYREVWRCLKPGGLFFADGWTEELVILQQLGFQVVAYLEEVQDRGTIFELVMSKPT